MKTSASNHKTKPSAAARAEAAAWVARLHGPNRTAEVEAGLRRWLAEDPERAAAFELVTDTWEKSARLRRRPLEEVVSWQRSGLRLSVTRLATSGIAVAMLAVLGTLFYLRDGAPTIRQGEQRARVLDAGAHATLNANTGADADRQNQRVAKSVLAASLPEERTLPSHLSKERAKPAQVRAAQVRVARQEEPASDLAKASAPDKALDSATAWQRGQVSVDDTRLADVVAEINHHSEVQLVVTDPEAAMVPVGSVFRAGDPEALVSLCSKTRSRLPLTCSFLYGRTTTLALVASAE